MKYVRLFTLAGILVACLLGCATRRSDNLRDSARTQEQNELVWLTSRTDAKVAAATTVTDRWRNLRIHWRDYDLSQSPDSSGNYPVKSEGWADVAEQESKNEQSEASENTKEEASGKAEAKRDESHETAKDTELEIQAGTQPLWWWLAGVLTAVTGIIILWWKYGKKDKTK